MRQIEEPQNRGESCLFGIYTHAHSLITEFTNIGVDPRTPEPSFTPRRFSSVAGEFLYKQ